MQNTILALIVDDEDLGRKNLLCAMQGHPTWKVAAECANVANARVALEKYEIDVVFLDIQMPRESGLSFARELSEKGQSPLIIFVTAFNEHAIEAFDLHALDYLLKPIDDHRLKLALERAEGMIRLKQQAAYTISLRGYVSTRVSMLANQKADYWDHVSVRSIGSIERVALSDVFWIEAQGNYMQLHMNGKKILYRASMSRLEKHLDPAIFLRIHRSTIIRKNQIYRMEVVSENNYKVRLHCEDEVLVSERYIAAVKNVLLENQSRLGESDSFDI